MSPSGNSRDFTMLGMNIGAQAHDYHLLHDTVKPAAEKRGKSDVFDQN